MKLTEIKGDLFAEKYQEKVIYAHCISEDFVMGKGIAKTFKQLFPELKAKDRLIANYKREKYKRLLAVPCQKAVVANLITKRYYYNKPTYETLKESLAELKEYVDKNGIKRIITNIKNLKRNRRIVEDAIKYNGSIKNKEEYINTLLNKFYLNGKDATPDEKELMKKLKK